MPGILPLGKLNWIIVTPIWIRNVTHCMFCSMKYSPPFVWRELVVLSTPQHVECCWLHGGVKFQKAPRKPLFRGISRGISPSVGESLRSNLQWVAFIGALYLAIRVGVAVVRRNNAQSRLAFRTALPIMLFAIAYTVLNIVVLSASMAHRH